MQSKINKIIFLCLLFLSQASFGASLDPWKIDLKNSNIKFTAVENDVEISGYFTKFNGDIIFAADNLAKSFVKMNIDTGEIKTDNEDIASNLAKEIWLNSDQYKQATFTGKKFKKIKDNHYQLEGELDLKGTKLPLVLDATFKQLSDNKSLVVGGTIISRNKFNVGDGEFKNSSTVKDEVKVEFTISANK